ncbi:unnamed protein product [Linum trigynum]|uniref:Uncharacterized protein n=1 Tax=Linum trigynum TaxID=586398 RepID=A0AAV2DY80_9ROSI
MEEVNDLLATSKQKQRDAQPPLPIKSIVKIISTEDEINSQDSSTQKESPPLTSALWSTLEPTANREHLSYREAFNQMEGSEYDLEDCMIHFPDVIDQGFSRMKVVEDFMGTVMDRD